MKNDLDLHSFLKDYSCIIDEYKHLDSLEPDHIKKQKLQYVLSLDIT